MKHHTFSYWLRTKKGDKLALYCKYRHGTEKQKVIKCDLTIPASSWDKKRGEVKSRIEFQQYREKFLKLDARVQQMKDLLNTDQITDKEALKRIPLWYVSDKDKTLENYFEEEYRKKKGGGYDPTRVRGIIKKLHEALLENNFNDLVPAKLIHFTTHKDEICNSLYKQQKKNTATDYLKRINTVLKKYDSKKYPDKYFEEHYKTEATKLKKPVERVSILESISRINTYKKLEAYLFWLYSFCLRGLDGIDVTLLDRSMLLQPDAELTDYHHQKEWYPEPIKVELSRKKTRAREFEIIINAYPTLSIQKLLKKVISINRSDDVNTEDDLKLFKWDSITNRRKWDLYSDFLQGRLKTLFNKSFKSTRHTFTSTAEILRVPVSDQSALIGNVSRKGSIKHYSKLDNTRLDIQHLAVLDYYQISRIYFQLLLHIKQHPELEIECVRHIDRELHSMDNSNHLRKSWQQEVAELTDISKQPEYYSGLNIYKGVL